jgi:hypothetical protein
MARKCSICKGSLHDRRTCPLNPNARVNPKARVGGGRKCTLCCQRGHDRRHCPRVRPCNVCKKFGHEAAVCPESFLRSLGFLPNSSETLVEVRKFQSLLSRLPLNPRLTPSTPGDCQFSAVRSALNLQESIPDIREAVANYVSRFMADSWAPSERPNDPQDFECYCQAIKRLAYGDQLTLVALCHLFHFNYVVLQPNGNVSQSVFNYPREVFLAHLPHAQHYVLLQVRVCFLPCLGN